MIGLDAAIKSRHSIRRFLPQAVPQASLLAALELAQHAPSNSNIQPWRLFVATGQRRDQLARSLLAAVDTQPPEAQTLPESFQHHRRELGSLVYGAMGIDRNDHAGRQAAVRRNYDFFGAPVAGILCLHQDLGPADMVGVGMYLQTLLLALTAEGLSSCVEVSLTAYPSVLRRELQIPDELRILCGVAIGYPDWDFAANHLATPRAPVAANVVFANGAAPALS